MNPKHVKKWQNVISDKENVDDDSSAFVKVKPKHPSVMPADVSLSCGNAELTIPVGVNVVWLGALIKELA